MFTAAAVVAILIGFGAYTRAFGRLEEHFKENFLLGLAVFVWAGLLAYTGAIGVGAFPRDLFAIITAWVLFVGGCLSVLVFGYIALKGSDEAQQASLLATLASVVTGLAAAKIVFGL